jgi:hypothetical protein
MREFGLLTENIEAACWLMPGVVGKFVGVFADDELHNIAREIQVTGSSIPCTLERCFPTPKCRGMSFALCATRRQSGRQKVDTGML